MRFSDFRRTVASTSENSDDHAEQISCVIYNPENQVFCSDRLEALVPEIRAALLRSGVVLLRGFAVDSAERLEAALQLIDGKPMSYRENTSPRSPVKGLIHTSTDHPADQAIEMHSEQSHSRRFPQHLYLACVEPPASGGQTPIADTRQVLQAIPAPLLQRLGDGGYVYRRIFHPGLGPDWQTTYQFDDREELEEHFREAGIEWYWRKDGLLQTEIRRKVVAKHPETREDAWFNHLLFWHHSSLEPELAHELIQRFGVDGLPNQSLFSDGSQFAEEEIDAIRQAFVRHRYDHAWRKGDLLVLDNVLCAHGRLPFTGPRRILFAMAKPVDAKARQVNWLEDAA